MKSLRATSAHLALAAALVAETLARWHETVAVARLALVGDHVTVDGRRNLQTQRKPFRVNKTVWVDVRHCANSEDVEHTTRKKSRDTLCVR